MENTIYIGENIATEGLKKNTLYTSRPTELIEKLSEKYSLIKFLFLQVTELSTAQAELGKVGSALYAANEQIKKALHG